MVELEQIKLEVEELQQAVETSQPIKDITYFNFYVYGGNYPETVWNALYERGNWKECKEQESIEQCHFLWRPFNFNADLYKRIDKRL